MRPDVRLQPSRTRHGGILPREIGEQIARRAHHDSAAIVQRAVREVAEEQRLADAVRSDEDDALAVGDEAQREEVLDLRAVDPLRPCPVEVAEGLEGSDACEMGIPRGVPRVTRSPAAP
jgi:hypothetical protein